MQVYLSITFPKQIWALISNSGGEPMSHDTWIHKLSRATIVRPLLGTGVTPNHLTTFRLGTGLAASGLIAVGSQTAMDIGAGLFVLSIILDRADGDLARQIHKQSELGHRYDLIADGLCNITIFLALGFALRGSSYGYFAPLMGIIAGLAVAGILAYAIYLEKQAGPRSGEIGSRFGFDPDDAILIVPATIWFGWTEQLLLAAAIGAPLFAIFYFLYFRIPRNIH